MSTPLSIDPYNSRFSLDTTLEIYNNTYNYVNMVYHGFYGGTSLQSQELNELQENIQNQLSLANILSGNWLKYNNNNNINGNPDGGMYKVAGLTADIFIPLDPKNSYPVNGTTGDWYSYKDKSGYEQFILLQNERNVNHKEYYDNIKTRIAAGYDPNWIILRDTAETFDVTGAHRIQMFFDSNIDNTYFDLVNAAYQAALNTLEDDCNEIISRFT